MKFKERFQAWLDKNGGLTASIAASKTMLGERDKEKKFELEQLENARFRPGCLYTFDYRSMDEMNEIRITGKMPYYDFTPFVLALSVDKVCLTALNLNVVPMPTRVLLFELLYKLYGQQIEGSFKKKHSDYSPFPKFTPELLIKLLKLKSRIAINKYKREEILNANVIKWESVMQAVTMYKDKTIIYSKSKHLNREIVMKQSLVK